MESAMPATLDAQPNNKNFIGRLKSIFVTNYINLRGKSDRLDFLIVFLILYPWHPLKRIPCYQDT